MSPEPSPDTAATATELLTVLLPGNTAGDGLSSVDALCSKIVPSCLGQNELHWDEVKFARSDYRVFQTAWPNG